jgi:hypothetical protein
MTTTTQRTITEDWPSLERADESPNTWQSQHNKATRHDGGFGDERKLAEFAIVNALNAWQLYGAFHEQRYDSLIGDDGVLGAAWLEMGKSLCQLLDGEIGRLNGGTCWSYIDDTLRRGGFEDGLET